MKPGGLVLEELGNTDPMCSWRSLFSTSHPTEGGTQVAQPVTKEGGKAVASYPGRVGGEKRPGIDRLCMRG